MRLFRVLWLFFKGYSYIDKCIFNNVFLMLDG